MASGFDADLVERVSCRHRTGSPRTWHGAGAFAGRRYRPRPRAGAASRRLLARIPMSAPSWAWRPCAACKAKAGNLAPGKVFATLKHHDRPWPGRLRATMSRPPCSASGTLREFFFPPSRAVVERTGIAAVMPSYNEIDGVPQPCQQIGCSGTCCAANGLRWRHCLGLLRRSANSTASIMSRST